MFGNTYLKVGNNVFNGNNDIIILYINNSLHLGRKYARIFVRGHYLFREANSFPRGYRVYCPSNLFRNARRFENWGLNNSLYLGRRYAGIFVRGHNLFREANSSESVARGKL